MIAKIASAAALAACLVTPCAAAPAAPYQVSARISAADGGWDFASVDAVRGKLYVARSNAVTAVDLASGKVVDKLADAHRGHAVLVLDGGATLFETDGETGLGRFIAATDGAVLAEVSTGKKPDAALYDAVSGRIAVMNAGDGTVALVDPVARKLVGSFAVKGGLEFAVADGKGGAFINLEDDGAIAHIDLKAGKEVGRYKLAGCEGPTGLALVRDRLISACANGVAVVSNPTTGKVTATLPIGRDPDAVLVDASRGLAFVPCGGTGTLVALNIADIDHVAVAATIATQIGAKTGAVDPRDGRIYLPAATLAAPEPGAKRGRPVPGSFVILVITPGA
ncbi:MAG: PQQ-binding-like beta-propeller repeat protein [Sphingomonadales bacterium]|nr:PQQ-binding-like beta-propeller repeat protein [Sphingomonadales bacterium]